MGIIISWKHRKVLVTGAGGFIGSHLTERLVELGAKTRALVHYNSDSSSGWLDSSSHKENIEIIRGDIRDKDSLVRAVEGVDVIFHLAALIAIPYSYNTPLSYLRTNSEGTVNILQLALEQNAELVVHTSTSEVYGSAQFIPISENHPLNPQSPYAASKISADAMAKSFHLSYNMPVSIVRPFNTFGPRQSSRAVIPTIITQALTSSDIRLGNITPVRDFNFVADTVEGFIKVAESASRTGQVVNIGSGRQISIGELTNVIQNILGTKLTVIHDDQRHRPESSEVDRLCADCTFAKQEYAWEPKYTLEHGLDKTIEWIRSNMNMFKVDGYAV